MKNKTTFGMFTLNPYIVNYEFCPEHNWLRMQLESTYHPDVALSYECENYTAHIDRNMEIDESLKMDVMQLIGHYESVALMRKNERPRVGIVATKINL
jgi:hypothetical protein